MSHEAISLRTRLLKVVSTDGGDLVQGLTLELDKQQPKLIRGFVVEPGTGPDGMRHTPCTWLPNGRHRLYPKLNLTIPVL